MKLIIISIILIGLAVVLLALRLIVKGDKSPQSSHIEDSKALKKRGIGCANKQMAELASRQNLADRDVYKRQTRYSISDVVNTKYLPSGSPHRSRSRSL